ncbi:hypothetical protein [Frankia tisae]|uniref:hypothetical protein n=1 Tax=Frankia tisae TaxID=2950104 RepID=UPI0021C06738|nr:hypothetical protein [Frankia tisae]
MTSPAGNEQQRDGTCLPREDTGGIPFEKPSRHRSVRLDDLIEYRSRQRIAAELAFTDMIADTERLGLYDADSDEIRAALKVARRTAAG